MTEKLHYVDINTCTGDGICAEICPEDVFEIVDGHAAAADARASACILCGQCVAVCPSGSIQMPKLPMENFHELSKKAFGYDDFLGFLNLRRSVRTFKDRPVERDLIEKILEAAATAPMGFPPHTTEVLVIDRQEEMDFLLRALVQEYDFMHKGFSNPVTRALIRLRTGAENYATMKNWILEVSRHANQAYRQDRSDRYMYRAPVLMLFHANRWMISHEENAHLVCSQAMLAAVSLGLGTTIIGLVPPMVDRLKILRKRYGIPEENKVITSLILGYPKYKYKKGIRRKLAGVRYV